MKTSFERRLHGRGPADPVRMGGGAALSGLALLFMCACMTPTSAFDVAEDAQIESDGGLQIDASGPDEDARPRPDAGAVDAAMGDVRCAPPSPLPVRPTISGRRARIEGFPSIHLPPRGVTVFLPADYQEGATTYPVMYLHDGQNLFDAAQAAFGVAWEVDAALENTDALPDVPGLIVVGIDNTADRIAEYTPTAVPEYPGSGQAEAYGRFLVEELKPWVDTHFRTRCGPADTGIGGSSLGGLVSVFLGAEYPETFGRIAALSPSFWWDDGVIFDWLPAYTEGPGRSLRLWIDAGTLEGGDEDGDGLTSTVADTRAFVNRLVQAGVGFGERLGYLEVWGGRHDESSWARRFPAIMGFLWADGPTQIERLRLKTYANHLRPEQTLRMVVSAPGMTPLTVPNTALRWETTAADVVRLDTPGTLMTVAPGMATITASLGAKSAALDLHIGPANATHVTVTTPAADHVFMAGDHPALGDWRPDGQEMTPLGHNRFTHALPLPIQTRLLFKFTRGTWETVETTAQGADIENRALILDGENHFYTVDGWASAPDDATP